MLKRNKTDNSTLFIDASAQFVCGGNGHELVANDQVAENGYNRPVVADLEGAES